MRKLIVAIVVLAILAVGICLFMQTTEIVVEGNIRYSAEEIIAASQLKPEGVLFLADISGIAANQVTISFPYIESTKIAYSPPGTLIIRVTESEPVAYLTAQDGSVALLSQDGRVLEINPTQVEGIQLLNIDSPTAHISADESDNGLDLSSNGSERLRYALEIIGLLREKDLSQYVTYLNASILNPQFDLNRLYIVDMGMRDSSEKKIETLIRTVRNLESGSTGTIDLSVLGEAHFIPS